MKTKKTNEKSRLRTQVDFFFKEKNKMAEKYQSVTGTLFIITEYNLKQDYIMLSRQGI